MRKLLVLAATAAALATPAAMPAAQAYSCGGMVDMNCSGWVCPTDCWQRSCWIWVDLMHNSNTAQCVQHLPVQG